MIVVNHEKCIKCNRCIDDCVVKIIRKNDSNQIFMPEELEKYCLNCQHCLAICPTGALTCGEVTAAQCDPVGDLPTPENMLNLLRQRRSIRRFRNENIAPEVMEKLKRSLAWSATGCNDHSLFFRIVDNRDDMTFFREKTASMLKFLVRSGILKLLYPNVKRFLQEIMNGEDVVFRNAPHMIVCAVNKKAPCKEADPWIALSNFDLFAQTLNIGTCWCGFAGYAFKFNRAMRKKLDIPHGWKIASVMLFGPTDITYARATNPPDFKISTKNNS